MSDEIAGLYKALDKAIRGFEARITEVALESVEREKSEVEKKLHKLYEQLSKRESKAVDSTDQSKPPTANTPPGASPSGGPKFQPLPKPLTVGNLTTYLRALGFRVANNRPEGGGLWVFHDEKAFGTLAQHLERLGVQIKYFPGGRKRYKAPHYALDPSKRLML